MSPKEITRVDITEEVFKEPSEAIEKIASHLDIDYTKVIQTYVMEDRKLNLALDRQGSIYFKGQVAWIGNKKDGSRGTIICIDTRNELTQINPSPENTEQVLLDIKKETIRISTVSKTKCIVCGKDIEIFDEVSECPVCQSKAHMPHLAEYVKMKHSCPVCKKELSLSPTGAITYD